MSDRFSLSFGKQYVLVVLLTAVGLGLLLAPAPVLQQLDDLEMPAKRFVSAVSGERYTITNFSATTTGDTPLRFTATVMDDTATAYDPAVIQLQLHNTADRALMVSTGVFWPFGYLTATDNGHGFTLWSPQYKGQHGHPLDRFGIRVIPAILIGREIGASATVRHNFTIHTVAPGIQPGSYQAANNLTVSNATGIIDKLQYRLAFELTG